MCCLLSRRRLPCWKVNHSPLLQMRMTKKIVFFSFRLEWEKLVNLFLWDDEKSFIAGLTARASALSFACSVRFIIYCTCTIYHQFVISFFYKESKLSINLCLFARSNILLFIRNVKKRDLIFHQTFPRYLVLLDVTGYSERQDSWGYLKHI